MVNSPSTTATEMSEAASRPDRRLGRITRSSTALHPAPSVRAASARVVTSIASIEAWIER